MTTKLKECLREQNMNMNSIKWWIARNKDYYLDLYNFKPIKVNLLGDFEFPEIAKDKLKIKLPLPVYLFPEVTWENSPQEIELKLCNIDSEHNAK